MSDAGRADSARRRAAGDVVLQVDGLSKKFCRSLRRSLFYAVQDIGVELTGSARRSDALRKGEFWALRDVSFTMRQGESLGLVGPNGSGKTTLLRIIGGLIKPDQGTVRVRGTVAPLIALGAGFSPVLTGRENIHTNMAILGLSSEQIDQRFDDVVEFAEIGEAIDAPVRTYSSGMAARLGFACAIHTDPDVFLIDEVLAVGDLQFRLKCYRKLTELRERGTSFILVSHNPQIVLSNCRSALYLKDGESQGLDEVSTVMARYENDLFQKRAEAGTGTLRLPARSPEESTGLDILSLSFADGDGAPVAIPVSGRPLTFRIEVIAHEAISGLSATLVIKEQFGEGEWILRLSTLSEKRELELEPGRHEIQLALPHLGLRAGDYVMKLNVAKDSSFLMDVVEAFHFRVDTLEEMSQCIYYQPREWKVVAARHRSPEE